MTKTSRDRIDCHPSRANLTTIGSVAYAAPLVGIFFFYMPMWGILPGVYAKHFGLELTAVAAVLLAVRMFDGVIDLTIGFLADWHRSKGGSRKPWVIAGGLGSAVACYFLFLPPETVSISYYLIWSLIYFLAFTIAVIPHQTWGSELTLDYQGRARIFGFCSVMLQLGAASFYALPLLPIYASRDYTPELLHDAIYVGALMTIIGIGLAAFGAPRGIPISKVEHGDNLRVLARSVLRNRPLHCLIASHALSALGFGMWMGTAYVYVDSYLLLGEQFAIIFLAGFVWAALTTPFWLKLIKVTSKAGAWATGVALFVTSLAGMLLVAPGELWWAAFLLVFISPLYMTCTNVMTLSILGDIVDYGKLKFHKDYGATYYAFNNLVFKLSVGLGGGLSLGVAGLLGFDPSDAMHDAKGILGLKLAFLVLPACFLILSLFFILRTPITRSRHNTIQRRLESRVTAAHVLG